MLYFFLFQVYAADCSDGVLLELRKYLPKYHGVWSPPTAPNGNISLKVHLSVLIHAIDFLKALCKSKQDVL
jgi:hypothetical protein